MSKSALQGDNLAYLMDLAKQDYAVLTGKNHPDRTKNLRLLTEAYHEMRRDVETTKSWVNRLQNTLKHVVVPSFKHPETPFHPPYKIGLVTLGVYMAPQGLYHAIEGGMEQTPQTAGSSSGLNLTRVFVGSFESVAGTALLYFGLTKGGSASKIAHDMLKNIEKGHIPGIR